MAGNQLRLTAEERADLVAYLDGELPKERSRALAETLTRSVSGRREVEALEAAWGLLELLPRSSVGDAFTEQTVTIAAEAPATDDRLVGAARKTLRQFVTLLVVCAGVTAGGLTGYVAARWLWPDPTTRLARDLTIAERLDDYQAVGSMEFLRRLDDSTFFKEASD